jgi:hypothetical protein
MSPQERDMLRRTIGMSNANDANMFEYFFRDSSGEARICDYLKVPTESAKVAKATFEAAWYARAAFIATLASLAIGVASTFVEIMLAR